MIGRLWRRLRAWFAVSRPPASTAAATPFVHEMRAYTAAGIQQTRASLRAQRRDRARYRTNFWADDQFGGPPPPEEGCP